MEFGSFRDLFPAVRSRTYLNTAGGGAMSTRAAVAGRAYYDEAEALADVSWNDWLDRSEKVRKKTASFIGAVPEHVSFLQNASLGLNIVARSMEEKSEILAVDGEFPSCTTPFMRAGHDVRFVETPEDGSVHADDVARALSAETSAFVLSSVQFANGFRANLGEIGSVCRAAGVGFIVDATQSICAYDLDVGRDAIDAVVFSGYKWATAGYGIAVLYLDPGRFVAAPPLVGWRSAAEPYLLENDRLDLVAGGVAHEMGHPPFPGIFTMGAALELFQKMGLRRVSERIDRLVEDLRFRLEDAGFRIVSSAAPGTTSGILLVGVDAADEWAGALRRRNVWTTARRGGLRVSVHAYNDESDLASFMDAMRDVGKELGGKL